MLISNFSCQEKQGADSDLPEAAPFPFKWESHIDLGDDPRIIFGPSIDGKRCGTWLAVNRYGKTVVQVDYGVCRFDKSADEEEKITITYNDEFGGFLFKYFVTNRVLDSIAFNCHRAECTLSGENATFVKSKNSFTFPF